MLSPPFICIFNEEKKSLAENVAKLGSRQIEQYDTSGVSMSLLAPGCVFECVCE